MQTRGRPRKYKLVRQDPRISQFSPRGRPGRPNEANLAMEEYESIRLADFLGFSQKEAAKSMHISQQTFSRIIRKARKVISDAIVTGKIIKIQGGHYVLSYREEK
jgi:predicted DNA-binding protein (UPF0251 family)